MALEPIKRKMQIKKVAGFHSFTCLDLEEALVSRGSLNAFGMIECHIEG